MRVTKAQTKQRRHKKVAAQTKGMQKGRRRSYRLGKQAVTRSLQYAYRDRRTRKRDFRKLWIQRINNAARLNGTTYSKLIAGLKDKQITLDRKVLSEIAIHQPEAFTAVVKAATK